MSAIAVLAAPPVLALIAIDDLRRHRIRNRDLLVLAAEAATVPLVAAIGGHDDVVGRAAFGALLGAAPLATAWIARPGRVGGGDVKLAAVLGALAGVIHPFLAVAVVGVGLATSLAAARALRSQRVALAPALATAFVVLVAGSAVA